VKEGRCEHGNATNWCGHCTVELRDEILRLRMNYANKAGQEVVLIKALDVAEKTLKANHKHHLDYDDYDGYPDSELCNKNKYILAKIRKIKKGYE
jgi:hypothetical protein